MLSVGKLYVLSFQHLLFFFFLVILDRFMCNICVEACQEFYSGY